MALNMDQIKKVISDCSIKKEEFTNEICRGIPQFELTTTGRIKKGNKESKEYKACKKKAEDVLDKGLFKGIETAIKKCSTDQLSGVTDTKPFKGIKISEEYPDLIKKVKPIIEEYRKEQDELKETLSKGGLLNTSIKVDVDKLKGETDPFFD